MIRLAIYYTPPPDTPLTDMARRWLGRDNTNLRCRDQEPPANLPVSRFREIIASPFHYGFHGTIKPPFHLHDGVTIEAVQERLESFAANQQSFVLPNLEVRAINNFICLRPTRESNTLNNLAARVVEAFDDFRLPPGSEELAGRRGAGLSSRQERLLTIWGYPYVMEEFRFHLTLTGNIAEHSERALLAEELSQRFPPEALAGLPFSALSLFLEKNGEPMVELKNCRFAKPATA